MQKRETNNTLELNYSLFKKNFGPLESVEKHILKHGTSEPSVVLSRCLVCDHKWGSKSLDTTCPACGVNDADGQAVSRLRVRAREGRTLKLVKKTGRYGRILRPVCRLQTGE